MFDKVLNSPERPFVAILGGAKIADKLPVVQNLIDKVDTILIGGGMAYTFLKAIGGNVGMSITDNTKVDFAKQLLDEAKEKGVKIVLPIDNVGAKDFSEEAESKLFSSGFFADDYQGMDIGPKTIKMFKKVIKKARTIVWNGPVGVYEYEKFEYGKIVVTDMPGGMRIWNTENKCGNSLAIFKADGEQLNAKVSTIKIAPYKNYGIWLDNPFKVFIWKGLILTQTLVVIEKKILGKAKLSVKII